MISLAKAFLTLSVTAVVVALSACSKVSSQSGLTMSADSSAQILQKKSVGSFGLAGTKTLVLTFDDGPVEEVTDALLDVLQEENIHATFFIWGEHIAGNEKSMARMKAAGHVIGNHTMDHHNFRILPGLFVSEENVQEAISSAHQALLPYLKETGPLYFRAPGGAWDGSYADVLNSNSTLRRYIGPLFWNIGGETKADANGVLQASADWDCWDKQLSPEQCGVGYLNEVAAKRGGVVLMHDKEMNTVAMVRELIHQWRAQGYTFATMDDVENLKQFAAEPAQAPTAE